ncbi:MAG: hypothetical protein WDN48_09275 [Pseudolabrys sp.]
MFSERLASPFTPKSAALKLEEFLPYRLNVCANSVSHALSRIYGERHKIGVPEWRVLVTLGEYGMMTAKAIGGHSHMHKTKVIAGGRHAGAPQIGESARQTARICARPFCR